MQSFWNKIPKPAFVMAPLANVTDAAFRRTIAKHGKPDAFYTEFVSADGLFLGNQKILLRDLVFHQSERPVVAQFFTSKPEMMKKAAALAKELGFDGIDINMGCPDKSVERQGAGAALMKNPKLAREIIRAAKEGADGLPVSVKTRVGYNKIELETWLPEILAENPAVVTVHARTRKEMSKVPARWEHVKRAVEIRNELKSEALIFGNGDALSLEDAKKKAEMSGADGVMLGRAIFGNPWLFKNLADAKAGKNTPDPRLSLSMEDRLRVMVEHTKLFEELLGDIKNFDIMKKHYKAYVNGWDGAKELRMKLMEAKSAANVEKTVEDYLKISQSVVL